MEDTIRIQEKRFGEAILVKDHSIPKCLEERQCFDYLRQQPKPGVSFEFLLDYQQSMKATYVEHCFPTFSSGILKKITFIRQPRKRICY